MPHQSRSCRLIICADMILSHVFHDAIQNLLILRYSQLTIHIRNDIVGSPSIKSCDNLAVFIGSHRILGLIPVSERLLHPHNGLHTPVYIVRFKAADSNQTVPNLLLFKLQLFFIRKDLKLTSPALPVTGTFRFHTKRRRRHHLLQPGIGIILFTLQDPGFHCIAHDSILHKQGKTIYLTDTFSVVSDITDFDYNHIIFLKFHV